MGRKRKPVINQAVEAETTRLMNISDNFVLQSEFGIIEVQDGEIVYNNIK